ncbi:MAG: metal-dependent transcriptional regulator [Nitrospinota bacterium]
MEIWKAFSQQEVTHSMGHYLQVIRELHQELGYARVTDIARRLSLTRGTVTTSLKPLLQRGLIEKDPNHFVRLTAEGQQAASRIVATYRILEYFLSEILGVGPTTAKVDSCKMEHLLSRESGEALLSLIQFLHSDDPDARRFLKKFQSQYPTCESTPHEGCPVCEAGSCLIQGKEKE